MHMDTTLEVTRQPFLPAYMISGLSHSVQGMNAGSKQWGFAVVWLVAEDVLRPLVVGGTAELLLLLLLLFTVYCVYREIFVRNASFLGQMFFLFFVFSLTVLTLYEHNIGFKIWTEFNVTCPASSECLIVYLYQVLLSLALQPPSTIAFSRNSSNINWHQSGNAPKLNLLHWDDAWIPCNIGG